MKRCKFLTLMLALLLLLQSSALAADKGKTVTVTLPTFAIPRSTARTANIR